MTENHPLEARAHELLAAGDAEGAATALIEALGPSVLGYVCALHGDDDGADVFSAWSEDVWRGLPGSLSCGSATGNPRIIE